jgi:hypothetical protein
MMVNTQIERLRTDSRNLDNYAQKLKKQGRTDVMYKILKKKAFLDKSINDLVNVQLKAA